MTETLEVPKPTRQAKAKTSPRSAIDAEFDRQLKRVNKTKKLAILKPKRRRGRPKVGRVVFTQKQLDKLPEYGRLADVSRALDVRYTTIQQWCSIGDKPLEFMLHLGHKTFRRDVLVSWLKVTKRLKIKE